MNKLHACSTLSFAKHFHINFLPELSGQPHEANSSHPYFIHNRTGISKADLYETSEWKIQVLPNSVTVCDLKSKLLLLFVGAWLTERSPCLVQLWHNSFPIFSSFDQMSSHPMLRPTAQSRSLGSPSPGPVQPVAAEKKPT